MLSKPMKRYVMSNDKKGFDTDTRNAYNKRLREYAVEAIKDLALLAEKLPEKEQAIIFNDITISPFFQNLFCFACKNPEDKNKTPGELLKTMGQEHYQERQQRILRLCYEAMNAIGDTFNATHLAPHETNFLNLAGHNETLPVLAGVKAVYLAAFYLPPQAHRSKKAMEK